MAAEFWDTCDCREVYSCTDFDEAVELCLENYGGEFPETLDVYGFDHPTISDYGLENIIEYLDDNYGNPDGDSYAPSQQVKDAWEAFCRAVAKDYKVWILEKTCTKTINVREWCTENRNDWLEKCKS